MRGESSAIRFSEAQKLLDYGFNNFEYLGFTKQNDSVKSIKVNKGVSSFVDLVYENDSGFIVKKGDSQNIITNISLPESISAPVYKNQKIGEITYSLNGNIISSVNIVANDTIKSLSFTNMITKILGNWFKLFR